MKAKTNNSENN